MRIRGLLIAVVLLAALGGAVYWSNKHKTDESKADETASPKILTIPQDQIQQIEIRRRTTEPVILRKSKSGPWEWVTAKPFALDQDSVGSLVSTLASLASDRLVEDKITDPAQYGLTSPLLQVVVTKKDGKTITLDIGDEAPTGSAYFVRIAGDPRLLTVASFNKSSLDKSPADLRDKRLMRFDTQKVTRVELNAKGQSIEFGKDSQNEWQIIKPKPLRADNSQVQELVRKLGDARMDISPSDDEKKIAEAFGAAAKVADAKVTDTSGTYTLDVRKGKDNTYYARSSMAEGMFKVASDLGTGLDKSLDDFRNKKLFDFGWNDPAKVEVRDGTKQVSFTHSGDKWMSGSKRMDSPTVQNVVDKLRDLSAAKFVETLFSNPVIEATVTSNDGKRTEKVLIASKGEAWYAKRENEPSIYELDEQAVTDLQKAVSEVKEYQEPKTAAKKK